MYYHQISYKCLVLDYNYPNLFGQSARTSQSVESPLIFIQISDIHLNAKNQKSLNGLNQSIREIGELNPAFVVVTGDLIDTGDNHDSAFSRKTFGVCRDVSEHLSSTGIPVYEALGNHDIVGIQNKSVDINETGYGKAEFLKTFGLSSTYYSFEKGGYHFIILDPNVIDKRWNLTGKGLIYEINDSQMQWLSRDLHQNRDPTIVFMHEPTVNLKNPEKLWNILRANDVRMIFSGHWHENHLLNNSGIPEQVSGALSGDWWSRQQSNVSFNGYRIVVLNGSKIDSFYKAIGKPKQINLVEPVASVLSGEVNVKAQIWSNSTIRDVSYRIDNNSYMPMGLLWEGIWNAAFSRFNATDLSSGYHSIEIKATDDSESFGIKTFFKIGENKTINIKELLDHNVAYEGKWVKVEGIITPIDNKPFIRDATGSIYIYTGFGYKLPKFLAGERLIVEGFAEVDHSSPQIRLVLFNSTDVIKEINVSNTVEVIVNSTAVVAKDRNGLIIAEGVAGKDDAMVLQKACNYAGPGEIRLYGNFIIPANTTIFLEKGVHLIGEGREETKFNCSSCNQDLFEINLKGYDQKTTRLTTDSKTGTRSIIVSNSSQYSVGDYIKVLDDQSIDGYKNGEIAIIEKIDDNAILTTKSLRDNFTVARNAAIRKLTMAEDTRISGIKFSGPGTEKKNWVIKSYLLVNSTVDNCEFYNWGEGIQFTDSINCIVTNNLFHNIYLDIIGYSVSIANACDDILITENHFYEKGRHYIDCTAATGTYLSNGWPRRVMVTKNLFEDSTDAAISTHTWQRGPLVIIGNKFVKCYKGAESYNSGLFVSNNEFFRCNYGVYPNSYSNIANTYAIISNNIFKECASYDIYSNADNLTITNNEFSAEVVLNGNQSKIANNIFSGGSGNFITITGYKGVYKKDIVIENNKIVDQNGKIAIDLNYVNNASIIRNYLSNSGGIELKHCIEIKIINNTIINCKGIAFRLYDVDSIYMYGNYVNNCSQALLIDGATDPDAGIRISQNYFLGISKSSYHGYSNVTLDNNFGI
jgi:UDP-2,3-diacylglucosamine pyrophosphatase LpxH